MDPAVLRARRIADSQGHEEVDVLLGKDEVGRQDPDDHVGRSGQRDRPSHDRAVAAPLSLPQRMAENDDLLPAVPVVGLVEGSSDHRPRAQRLEEASADESRPALEGLGSDLQVEGLQSRPAHLRKRARGLFEVLELRRREVVLERNESLGVGVREGPQQHSVHHREDRRIGSDPEGERRNGDRGEARGAREGPQRVADVLEQCHAPPRIIRSSVRKWDRSAMPVAPAARRRRGRRGRATRSPP